MHPGRYGRNKIMLQDILQNKKCFKLVCGAGNENEIEVEKLIALYALAGANYFDLSAKIEIINAAKKGLERVIDKENLNNYYLNVSVGIKGDPHVSKAVIDKNKCVGCGNCEKVCNIQRAVIGYYMHFFVIDKLRCIGCSRCKEMCPTKAINIISETKPIEQILNFLLNQNLSSIEFHAVSGNVDEILKQWNEIEKYFNGMLSLCTDRSHLSDKDLIDLIKEIIKNRKDYTTIIQADGCPMSGCNDKEETTLQALSTAQIVQKANLPIYLMLSGGTNSKTGKLAKLFNINAHGVALGSYARMIVKEYIERDDFFENKEVFNKALEIAKNLVDETLKYLGE